MNVAGRKSKKQKILDEALKQKEFERERVIEILKNLNRYTPALHPLIEMYLDACEVYYIKYSEWKDTGFRSTKQHTNKNGSRNEMKHPLAQQVEVWSEKKAKFLNSLGLDMKHGELATADPLGAEHKRDQEKKKVEEPEEQSGRLIQFKKMAGGSK